MRSSKSTNKTHPGPSSSQTSMRTGGTSGVRSASTTDGKWTFEFICNDILYWEYLKEQQTIIGNKAQWENSSCKRNLFVEIVSMFQQIFCHRQDNEKKWKVWQKTKQLTWCVQSFFHSLLSDRKSWRYSREYLKRMRTFSYWTTTIDKRLYTLSQLFSF